MFAALSSLVWWLGPGQDARQTHLVEGLTRLAQRALPDTQSPNDEVRAVLIELAPGSNVDLTLVGANGHLIANAGPVISLPDKPTSGWIRPLRKGATMALKLPDGRWLMGRHGHHRGPPPARWLWSIVLRALAVAIGAYPVAKRITRRSQLNVEQLGDGLTARVDVQGRDEVAQLARSFNDAATKIERLVDSQRTMLASASHELRSPLARMRVAMVLLKPPQRPDLVSQIDCDIRELDSLIDELLLASKFEALEVDVRVENVDLLAVAEGECAHIPARLTGAPVIIQADPALIHRVVRNLLQNAARHRGLRPCTRCAEVRTRAIF